MTRSMSVGFLTTVSGRWPRELPRQRLKEYGEWLRKNLPEVNLVRCESIVDSTEGIQDAIELFKRSGVRLVIMLYGAFTGDDVCTAIADELNVPLILWAPREPELHGGRLLANAMVALTMNSGSLYRLGHLSYPIYGGLESGEATKRVLSLAKAYNTVYRMQHMTLGLFGYRPTAFYNSAFDEGLIRRTFGIKMEETDLKVVFDLMASLDEQAVAAEKERVKAEFTLDATLPEEYLDNHARLYLALKGLMQQQSYDYATIKCWPEMGNLKTTPCAVLGRLIDDGCPIACEGDVDAALAMIAQTCLSGQSNFITDMIDMNEEENYLTFWHCGNAAPSLHHSANAGVMGDHPLAGQGTAFYTTLKEGPVTISRLCNIDGEYKLFLLRGNARQTNLYTPGCMINVTMETPVKDVLYGLIERGVPHHYSIVWEDVYDQMATLADLLGLEVITF